MKCKFFYKNDRKEITRPKSTQLQRDNGFVSCLLCEQSSLDQNSTVECDRLRFRKVPTTINSPDITYTCLLSFSHPEIRCRRAIYSASVSSLYCF